MLDKKVVNKKIEKVIDKIAVHCLCNPELGHDYNGNLMQWYDKRKKLKNEVCILQAIKDTI